MIREPLYELPCPAMKSAPKPEPQYPPGVRYPSSTAAPRSASVSKRAGTCGDLGMSPRILIVDDHEVVRHGVRSILARARPQWEICGEASDGKRAIESALLADPDVIVLD